MNNKDKEAFDSWWKENMVDPNWLTTDHASDVFDSWQAACDHKQKEISELESKIIKIDHAHGRYMELCKIQSDDLDNAGNELFLQEGKIKELQAENAKLRECVEFYADLNDEVYMYDSRGISTARQCLKDLDKNEKD